MTQKPPSAHMVSWEAFDSLYEHHFDCLRKIGFLVKAGSGLGEERTAVEVIGEFIGQKQEELAKVRHGALAERVRAEDLEAAGGQEGQRASMGAEVVRPQDRVTFGRLREICAMGGDEWEHLKAYTESVHAILKKRQEENR